LKDGNSSSDQRLVRKGRGEGSYNSYRVALYAPEVLLFREVQ